MFPQRNSLPLIFATSFFIATTIKANASFQSCTPENSSPIPNGEIVLEEGSPLDLYCTLNPRNSRSTNYSAHDLIFSNSRKRIKRKLINVINETTAHLHIKDLRPIPDTYYCTLALQKTKISSNNNKPEPSEELICFNQVIVQSKLQNNKPKNIENFSCISYNLEILICIWTAPRNHYNTSYSIHYDIAPGKANHCPEIRENSCTWTLNTEPKYDREHEYLNFTVVGTNQFGNTFQRFNINHYANMIPSPPKNLNVLNKTTSSIYLRWNIGALSAFNGDLIHKIEVMSTRRKIWDTKIYLSKEVDKSGDLVGVNITGLTHPDTPYDFRVYIRSSTAVGDDKWSPPAKIVVKTKP